MTNLVKKSSHTDRSNFMCQTSFFIIIKRKRKRFSQEIRFGKKAIWSRQCSALAINAIVIYSTLNNHSVWETSYSLKKNFKEKSHSTLYSDKFPVFFLQTACSTTTGIGMDEIDVGGYETRRVKRGVMNACFFQVKTGPRDFPNNAFFSLFRRP